MRKPSLLLLACSLSAPAALAQKVCFDQTDYATGDQPSWVAIGDLNEDGTPDLVATNRGNATLSILLGLGNGDFGPAASVASGATPRSVALGDVTGDGHLDALVAIESSNRVALYAGDGMGALTLSDIVFAGSEPRTVALADFDLDGALDLAVGHYAGADLRVYFGDGAGAFGEPFILAAPGNIPHMAVEDIDLDGDPDIVGGQDQFIFQAFVVENNGNRTFSEVGGTGLSGDPIWILLTDVNEDGLPDLVTPADDGLGALIEVAANDGSNHFSGFPISFLGYGGVPEAGDFDGDGHEDGAYDRASGPLSVALHDGNASFSFPEVLLQPSSASHLVSADLNGDGYDDLVAAGTSADGISVLISRGPGSVGSLSSCPGLLSVSAGGRQSYTLNSGLANAGELYLQMTTSAGDSPGLPLTPTSLVLPLNLSQLLLFTATNPGLLIPNSLGFLDAQGKRELELELPAGLDASLAGVTLHNAYVLFDLGTLTATFASNAAPLLLTL